MNRKLISGIAILSIAVAVLCIPFLFAGCSAQQEAAVSAGAGKVANVAGNPIVTTVAAAADPITGGLSTAIVGLVFAGASLVGHIAQAMSHATTKSILKDTQAMLAAAAGANAASVPPKA